jgi:hypothetical protein
MSWENIHSGDYGWVGKLRMMQSGSAVDISSYTTRWFVFQRPSGGTVMGTASFSGTGTDGYLQYTMESGVIAEAGLWRVEARISKAGAELTSDALQFEVESRVSG